MVSDLAKVTCANNLIVLVVDTLMSEFPAVPRTVLLSEFMSSRVCTQLYDLETRLWAEGPVYLLALYAEERGLDLECVRYYKSFPSF